MPRKMGDWYSYTGAIHMHTTESDGTKPIEEVIAIGQRAGLEFMMFTDHMNLVNRDNGHEGIYGDTLVVIGYEHNDLADEHHYLLFDTPGVYPEHMTPREYVAAGAADNAIGILAHPDEIRDRLEEYPAYPWRDWAVEGYTGIELWNQMSEWMEKLTKYNKLLMSLSPRKSMIGPTDADSQKMGRSEYDPQSGWCRRCRRPRFPGRCRTAQNRDFSIQSTFPVSSHAHPVARADVSRFCYSQSPIVPGNP